MRLLDETINGTKVTQALGQFDLVMSIDLASMGDKSIDHNSPPAPSSGVHTVELSAMLVPRLTPISYTVKSTQGHEDTCDPCTHPDGTYTGQSLRTG